MDVTNFLALSQASKEALKSANLLRSLRVNTHILGQHGTGKKTLAHTIVQNAPILSSREFDKIVIALENEEALIISDFDKLGNYETFKERLKHSNTRIIALSTNKLSKIVFDDFFSIEIYLPPLSERDEDVEVLINESLKGLKTIFSDIDSFAIDKSNIDLSNNIYSLKKSLLTQYFIKSLSDSDIITLLEHYFMNNLGGNNDYRDQLYLFEVPLFRAGMKKFKSQLQLAEHLGLNRNTLRKKLQENKDFL